MISQTGSYRYERFEKKAQVEEFERLDRQASILLEVEKQLWPKLGISQGKCILDLGCGSGVVTHELARKTYPTEVVGLDISQTLLKRGEEGHVSQCQNLQESNIQASVSFQQGSVYELSFPEASFDVVYARLLFQHLSKPIEALRNIWRVLKPGGVLCVLDIDKDWSSLYPEPETSVTLERAIMRKQLSQGGDPWVGRKLGHYLKSTGFTKVTTNVTLIDSSQLGLANFFEMLSFGSSYKSGKNEFTQLNEQARPDVQALINDPNAWAGFGLFVVTGRKNNSALDV